MFIHVPDRTPGKNSVHVDLHTPDVPAAVARATALGAKPVADFDEYGAVWTTLADPEGNLFDIGRA
jgi:predicted enzyme related to lactoylglutathione lyase